MRSVTSVLVAALVVTLLTACSSAEDLARGIVHDDGTGETAPCPPAGAEAEQPPSSPSAPASLDPTIAQQVATAIRAVRSLPAVDTATQTTTNTPSTAPDPSCATRMLATNHFASSFEVAMDADASPAQVGAVPTTMAGELAWTGVSLTLTVPAGPGHIASTTHYDSTFDQTIPLETSTSVAAGLATLASTPHVTGLEASIPYTMRVDYGSLNIGVDTDDQGVLDQVRAVIDTTAFHDTTLHGSFGNGSKP